MAHQRPFKNKKKWSLAVSYSGVNKQTNSQRTIIPGGVSSGKPQEVVKKIVPTHSYNLIAFS